MKAGDHFKVVTGNKKIGLLARNCGKVESITDIQDRGIKVTLSFRGKIYTVWARYAKTLENDRFNLGCGDGVNKITVARLTPPEK